MRIDPTPPFCCIAEAHLPAYEGLLRVGTDKVCGAEACFEFSDVSLNTCL